MCVRVCVCVCVSACVHFGNDRQEYEQHSQVCIHFLAGVCDRGERCAAVHPEGSQGWALLAQRWGVNFHSFDYAALSYLCKFPSEERDVVLSTLANMDLRCV